MVACAAPHNLQKVHAAYMACVLIVCNAPAMLNVLCAMLVSCCPGAADVPHIPPGTFMCLVTGTQQACKGRDVAVHRSNTVLVLLGIIRLPQHGSDLLVSVNAPTYISPGSSAAQQADAAGQQPAAQVQAADVMQGVLHSLVVNDWGLFGG